MNELLLEMADILNEMLVTLKRIDKNVSNTMIPKETVRKKLKQMKDIIEDNKVEDKIKPYKL